MISTEGKSQPSMAMSASSSSLRQRTLPTQPRSAIAIRWFSPIAALAIRHRLDQEATRVQPEYDKRKIRRNPRQDLFAVADFDGSALSKLGLSPNSNGVAVFLFDGNGVLVQYWQKVPDRESL